MGTLLYLVNNMSRSNALVVSQTAIAAGIGAKRERESSPEIPPRTQFHPERESRRGNRLRGQQQGRLAGEPGERYAAFGADVLAIEAEQEQDLIDDPRPASGTPPGSKRTSNR